MDNNLNINIDSAVNNSFFYTSDKYINHIDDVDILRSLAEKYPAFILKNEDKTLKKEFINIINDVDYVNEILEFYNMSIQDLIAILCKHYGSMFKGLFLKKVKDLIAKNYVRKRRKPKKAKRTSRRRIVRKVL